MRTHLFRINSFLKGFEVIYFADAFMQSDVHVRSKAAIYFEAGLKFAQYNDKMI